MTSLVLVGGGGHCHSCIDVIESYGKYKIAGIVDKEGNPGMHCLGYPWLGKDEDLPRLVELYGGALVTIGQIKSPDARKRIFSLLKKLHAEMPVQVSTYAHISRHATLGEGTIVMPGGIVNANAMVAENCIINSQALVEHGAVIEAHCHIATGAKVNGQVHVESGVFVGSGAVIHQGVKIGAGVVIAAGAVVCKDVLAATVYKGVR